MNVHFDIWEIKKPAETFYNHYSFPWNMKIEKRLSVKKFPSNMKVQNNAKQSSILGCDFVRGELLWWPSTAWLSPDLIGPSTPG